jgi:hypothetical protein
MIAIRLPRLFRIASVRFAALYVILFAGSALILGGSVFLQARSALQEQLTARIETETSYLNEEFRNGGLAHLIAIVERRGKGVSALDYLLQDRNGVHLAGEIPATPGLKPGWVAIAVPHASEDGGRPEKVRALGHRQVVGNRLGSGRVDRVNAANDARTRSDLRLPSLPR